MAKVEAEVSSSFLPKQSSKYDGHPYPSIPLHLNRHHSNFSMNDTCCAILLTLLTTLCFLSSLVFLLWPSQPEVKIIDIQLNHANISKITNKAFDSPTTISMDLRIQVRNRDFVTRDYNTITMLIEHEGKWKENTTTSGMFVNARSTSLLDLNTQLNLDQILGDMVSKNEDIIRESITLGIAIQIGGNFQFLFFNVPVNGRTSCMISIDMEKQTLTCQECCSKKSRRGT